MPDRPTATPPYLLLGFDFGLRRIGVASADSVSRTAQPLHTFEVPPRGIDWAPIEALVRRHAPAVLVVGHPGPQASPTVLERADAFARELAARSALPVHRVDEYASSIEAAGRLQSARANGRRRRVRRGDVDAAAAAVLLERWLDGPHNAPRSAHRTEDP